MSQVNEFEGERALVNGSTIAHPELVKSLPRVPYLRSFLQLPTSHLLRPDGLCKLCDIDDWTTDGFQEITREIMGTAQPVFHRKAWELTKAAKALSRHEMLQPTRKGLAVVGCHTRFALYLARHTSRIFIANPEMTPSLAWTEKGVRALEAPQDSPYSNVHSKNLRSATMNILSGGLPKESFDFAVCLYSPECSSNRRQSTRLIRQMAQAVRPGGIVVLTADCSLNGFTVDGVLLPKQITQIIRRSGLELVEPVNWGLSDRTLTYLCDIRNDDVGQLPHINVKLLCSVFTSVCLVFKKPGSLGTTLSETEWEERINTFRPRRSYWRKHRSSGLFLERLRACSYKLRERILCKELNRDHRMFSVAEKAPHYKP